MKIVKTVKTVFKQTGHITNWQDIQYNTTQQNITHAISHIAISSLMLLPRPC